MAHYRTILHSRNQPTTPAANEYTFVYDTTQTVKSVSGQLGKSAAISAVGGERGQGAGRMAEVTMKPIGQAVTFYLAILNGNAEWENVPIASVIGTPLTAGNLYTFFLTPGAGDWLIYCVAGGTAPTRIDTTLNILEE